MSSVIQVSQVYYPESDGKPLGQTDDHREEMVRHIEVLKDFYRGQKVYVSGDLLVYYVQGNPRKYVVPDAFVAKGISPRRPGLQDLGRGQGAGRGVRDDVREKRVARTRRISRSCMPGWV